MFSILYSSGFQQDTTTRPKSIHHGGNCPPPPLLDLFDDAAFDDAAAASNRPPEPRRESRPSPPPPRHVDHTYHDFSRFEKNSVSKDRRASSNFPAKLHMILSNPEHAHVISWMPHGRAWKILNKDLLVSEVIPQYFVQTKYESFTRQLSGWGFKRLHQSGPDFRAYYHECFLRGHPHLTQLMKRVPGNLGRLIPHVEGEPNFYEMSKFHPLPREEQWSKSPESSGIVPPPPPPNSYYGSGYLPLPSPPPASQYANSSSYSLSPGVSYATSYSTPYGGSRYDSYHATRSYATYCDQHGYYGFTSSFHHSQPPHPPPNFHIETSSHEYHLGLPYQHPSVSYAPDPYC